MEPIPGPTGSVNYGCALRSLFRVFSFGPSEHREWGYRTLVAHRKCRLRLGPYFRLYFREKTGKGNGCERSARHRRPLSTVASAVASRKRAVGFPKGRGGKHGPDLGKV